MAAPEPTTLVLAIGPSITPAGVGALSARVRRRIAGGPIRLVVCDVGTVVDPDIGTIDCLARLALSLRRTGCRLQLQRASDELRELLCLAGLDEIVPCRDASVVEVIGKTEQRKEPLGVEEERDPADPAT